VCAPFFTCPRFSLLNSENAVLFPIITLICRRVPTVAPAPMRRILLLAPPVRWELTTMSPAWTHVNFVLLERTAIKSVRAARPRACRVKSAGIKSRRAHLHALNARWDIIVPTRPCCLSLVRRELTTIKSARAAFRRVYRVNLAPTRQMLARRQALLVCPVTLRGTIAPQNPFLPSRALPAATALTPRRSFNARLDPSQQPRGRPQAQRVRHVPLDTIVPRDPCHPSLVLPEATVPTPRPVYPVMTRDTIVLRDRCCPSRALPAATALTLRLSWPVMSWDTIAPQDQYHPSLVLPEATALTPRPSRPALLAGMVAPA
jgi:hypothetical protein